MALSTQFLSSARALSCSARPFALRPVVLTRSANPMQLKFCLLFCALAIISTGTKAQDIRPGLWEVSGQVSALDHTRTFVPLVNETSHQVCFTRDFLDTKPFTITDQTDYEYRGTCSIISDESAGNTLAWTKKCVSSAPVKPNATYIVLNKFSPDSIVLLATIINDEMPEHVQSQRKRTYRFLGDCPSKITVK